MRRRQGRGFTLIELMIVCLLIGILAAIMLPNWVRAKYDSHWSACQQLEKNLASALETYSVQEHSYPDIIDRLTTASPPYIQGIPSCPSNGVAYNSGYSVASSLNNGVLDVYTIACPGTHHDVLPFITQGFPQYINGRGLLEYDSSR